MPSPFRGSHFDGIQIINSFVQMRKFLSQNAAVFQRLENLEQKQQLEIDKLLAESNTEGPKSWYYNPPEPLVVIANLNEPGVNRYVRMSLIVEVSSAVDQVKGTAFLNEKKPLLINYLTVYLSSLSIQDVRGDKNLKRIQSQIKDLLNEKLFPDSKPQITSILFKEFSIQ